VAKLWEKIKAEGNGEQVGDAGCRCYLGIHGRMHLEVGEEILGVFKGGGGRLRRELGGAMKW